jgi:outer membrane protein assembly factor BamB
MQRVRLPAFALLFTVGLSTAAVAADWRQFRGPGGLGVSDEKNLPIEWSSQKNVVWKTKLPGPGASSPVTVGGRIFLTCYTGYGLDKKTPGKMDDLRRHLVCVDRATGKILWTKEFVPVLPEHQYQGEGSYHGYSASTPTSDGERLYVFFGKSGAYCFDLDGNQLWNVSVGKGTNGWGSGTSPLLYKNLVIVNASVESGALVALDKMTGKEVWRTPGMNSAWDTPVLVTTPSKDLELVISVQGKLLALDPASGKELWKANGIHRYIVPSVVAHEGIVYATGGGHTSIAFKTGGRGDVTKTHEVWRVKEGSNASSPIYAGGYFYYASTGGGKITCQDAATGSIVYQETLKPNAGTIYASPILADGKLYFVSQLQGTYVVQAGPKFKLLAHNVFEDDKSRTNASLAVESGQVLLRNDQHLYCIGTKTEP